MSELRFQDLLFVADDGTPMPRARPAAILQIDSAKKFVLCNSLGYSGNARDLHQSMQPELALPSGGGLRFRWHLLHPLLTPSQGWL